MSIQMFYMQMSIKSNMFVTRKKRSQMYTYTCIFTHLKSLPLLRMHIQKCKHRMLLRADVGQTCSVSKMLGILGMEGNVSVAFT